MSNITILRYSEGRRYPDSFSDECVEEEDEEAFACSDTWVDKADNLDSKASTRASVSFRRNALYRFRNLDTMSHVSARRLRTQVTHGTNGLLRSTRHYMSA